jgi:hypothetical protein
MARKSKKLEPKNSSFLEALKFIGLVTRNEGPVNETHLLLSNNWAVTFNGILSAGIKIEENIYACPQSKLIQEAISKCGQQFSITQLDGFKLSVKGEKFKAIVPCIDPTLLYISAPDEPIGEITDIIKIALDIVGVLASETGQQVYQASVLLNGQSVIATNGHIIFEYWHGLNLPSNISLPKSIISVLTKVNKKLIKFGFSQSSFTFYFEDDSWIKTQLFADKWPDVASILNCQSSPNAIPNGFWEGAEAVAPFGDGLVYFDTGMLYSHPSANAGASYEVPGIPRGPIFSYKQLALIKPLAERIDFLAPGKHGGHNLVFFGRNMRGLIAGRMNAE